MTIPLSQALTPYIDPIFERKPKAVTAVDVGKLTSYTDTVVIVEAGSHRQVTSLAEHLIKKLKGKKIQALGAEGVKDGEWALLDFGHIIIHVFETEARTFYDLEGLWNDAPRIDLSQYRSDPDTGPGGLDDLGEDDDF